MFAVKMKAVLFMLLLCAPCVAFAQSTTSQPRINLRARGRSLILTSGRARRTLNVREQVYAARLDEVTLLLVTRKDSFVYLLVDACGPSKAVPDARRCGAADECALLWIKLDAAWKIADIKSALYESCWESNSSTDGYKINGRTLSIEYDGFSERKHYKLYYDAEQPERGFQVEESKLEDRATN
jgi:hypothetical protein